MLDENDSTQVISLYVNSSTIYGFKAIHYAAYRGNISIIKKLIEFGADYTLTNKKGLNVLHISVQGDQPSSLIFFIDKYKMPINSRDNLGSTPLHWACYLGFENSVNFIIHKYDKYVDINAQDNSGITPLHLAVISGIFIIIII